MKIVHFGVAGAVFATFGYKTEKNFDKMAGLVQIGRIFEALLSRN